VALELIEWGMLFPGGNKDIVKLLRLCVDYGQNKVLSIKRQIPGGIVPTVDLVRSYLNQPASSSVIYLRNELEVETVDLAAYDRKYGMVVEQ
jgi:hypothetical protein